MAFGRKPAPDVTGYPTPERAALAYAIAAHAAAVAHVNATDDASTRATSAVWDAQAALTAAQASVIEARDATVQHLIEVASGGTGLAPRTERQARDAVADAEAALDAARATRDALKGRLPDAEADRDRTARKRTDAARAVIAAEAAGHATALAVEVEALQRQSLAQGAALRWLVSAGAVPVITAIGFIHGQAADDVTRAAVMRHDMTLLIHTPDGWHRTAAAAGDVRWDAALTDLERDAAAPLPL